MPINIIAITSIFKLNYFYILLFYRVLIVSDVFGYSARYFFNWACFYGTVVANVIFANCDFDRSLIVCYRE